MHTSLIDYNNAGLTYVTLEESLHFASTFGWKINVYYHKGKDRFIDGAVDITYEEAIEVLEAGNADAIWLSKDE